MSLRSGPQRLWAALLMLGSLWMHLAGAQGHLQVGQSLYREGILPGGQPVSAHREGDAPLTGAAAACSNCHRRSGLGEIDGNIAIPPIAGDYLFHPPAKARNALTLPYIEGMRTDRAPYSESTLARAIRQGINSDGKPLNYLMPRYELSDEDLAVLIGYLRGMKPFKAPGVQGSVVNFATIITPDADPKKRQAMLEVLNRYFSEQNAFAHSQNYNGGRETMISNALRRWQLHVWDLNGAPATWKDQLRQHLEREPVYAVISGLGGRDWRPVHQFCEEASLPCLFPNVDLPVVAEEDTYSLYLSRGVLLEADLIAQQILADKESTPSRRVVQLFQENDVGEAAARALRVTLASAGVVSLERALKTPGTRPVAELLRSVRPTDALVLWLRPAEVASISNSPLPTRRVYASGLMAGLERAAFPNSWRQTVLMTYPVELPDKRTTGVDYALGWMAHDHIAVVDAKLQVDTYLACRLTLETLNHLSGTFVPDYLIESLEGMLEHQLISGFYPRLALAPHERFASKGGYLVHFTSTTGVGIAPDTEWRVPVNP